MRIVLIPPELPFQAAPRSAATWPRPGSALHRRGAGKAGGFDTSAFVTQMTHDLRLRPAPDPEEGKANIVGATAITPSIYKAERALQIAKELHPDAVTLLAACTPPSCTSRC